MAKPKRKHLAALDAEQRQRPSQPPLSLTDQDLSCNFCRDGDPTAEISWASSGAHDADSDCNSWVEVRKQRVVIIIPPLPEAKPKAPIRKAAHLNKQNAIGAPGENRTVRPPANRKSHGRDAPPISSMDILLASALGMDGTPSQAMQNDHIDAFASGNREEPSLDTADSSIQPKRAGMKMTNAVETDKAALKRHCERANLDKPENLGGPKLVYHSNRSPRPSNQANKRQCADNSCHLSVNQSLRLVTLKKHLERAGGLKGWLRSLGLDQFKEAFGKRRWSEWELLQLQMEDLKRMGKTAVGPRRKLIWAIHHVSQQTM